MKLLADHLGDAHDVDQAYGEADREDGLEIRPRGGLLREIKLEISEHSLDLHIPSYPGSPRSIDIGSSHSYESEQYHNNPQLREAIEFLHADKDLLIAAETGNDQLLEIILRRTDTHIQEMDHLGRNALHLAVCSGNIRAVEILLKAGVNPNIKDSVGMTPLSLCLMRRICNDVNSD
ncbi:uncharacterized protein LOC123698224 [Colias croceus]|uniref:uncharacterized protein LOC123698224 n=1 Tax=Colias crocea TaxID=72248 RepID=UPI001E27CF9A|nr:uncharacterized protein LOC123698224 [Colias croceus]